MGAWASVVAVPRFLVYDFAYLLVGLDSILASPKAKRFREPR